MKTKAKTLTLLCGFVLAGCANPRDILLGPSLHTISVDKKASIDTQSQNYSQDSRSYLDSKNPQNSSTPKIHNNIYINKESR